ncbi:glucose sorbosone dehydrogenase [Arthrobacter sp. MYb227]|uniref:PQQ-dependent sugar dehydrogenase n=1 Tax=Arthrobacter sp. MYb227 TaxID=1848601 RepID=UPI000CFCA91B|nr:PQQ-dependent sugar dehydrogenase [Arthrobacter sp. MYb227]PQZ95035.1 glucose sorbosone dehydrogenase [Arthrobacter sp. MYb227]
MTALGPAAGPRMDRRTVLILGGALGLSAMTGCSTENQPSATATPEQSGSSTAAHITTRATGLDTPWSMARTGDGSMLISERDTARILRLATDGTLTPLVHLPQVVPGGEAGLLGLAVISDSGTQQWLYAFMSTESDNRVVRMELQGSTVGPVENILTGIPRATIHNGGRIKQGPDGLLYIGTGDATDQPAAQEISRLNGKILRINPDGSTPESNPFTGSPVYSHGHRNVQGLVWDSVDRLWATELGPDRDDEVNLIRPGANYGWPRVTGAPHSEGLVDAAYVWPSTADASPSGMAIVGGAAYITALRGERLWRLELPAASSGNGAVVSAARIALDKQGRLRDVMAVSKNEILIATNEGTDSRILSLAL